MRKEMVDALMGAAFRRSLVDNCVDPSGLRRLNNDNLHELLPNIDGGILIKKTQKTSGKYISEHGITG